MKKLRYSGITKAMLIIGAALGAYRGIYYLIELIKSFGAQLTADETEYGDLMSYTSYLNAMSSKPDPITIITQALLTAAVACFTALAVILLLKGTENRKIFPIFYIAGLAVMCLITTVNMLEYAFICGLPFIAASLSVIAAAVVLFVWLKYPERNCHRILALLIVIMAAVLFVFDEYRNAYYYSSLDVLAMALCIGGFVKAAEQSGEEPEKNEPIESEE